MKTRMLTMAAIATFAATTALAQSGQTPGHMSGHGAGDHSKAMSSSTSGSSTLAPSDRRFVMEAARGGMAEVELGQLATSKASSADVRSFGQMMMDDHQKANDELKALAAGKGVTVPSDLGAAHKATRARLEKLSGEAFDKAYMKEMLQDHKKDVAEFKRAAQTCKDGELKSWASRTLPSLEKHLDHAQQAASAVNAGASAGTSATGRSSKPKPKTRTAAPGGR